MNKIILTSILSIFLVHCGGKNEQDGNGATQNKVEQGLAKVSHSRSDCPNLTGTYEENDQGKFSQKRIDTFSTESGLILDDSGSIFKIEGTRQQVTQPENGSYIGYCNAGKIVIDLYQGSILLGRMSYSPRKEDKALLIELTSLSSQFESRSETWSKK